MLTDWRSSVQLLMKHERSVYFRVGGTGDGYLVAKALACMVAPHTPVFHVEGETLSPSDGLQIVERLSRGEPVVLFFQGPSELAVRIAESWASYVEHRHPCNVARNLTFNSETIKQSGFLAVVHAKSGRTEKMYRSLLQWLNETDVRALERIGVESAAEVVKLG